MKKMVFYFFFLLLVSQAFAKPAIAIEMPGPNADELWNFITRISPYKK